MAERTRKEPGAGRPPPERWIETFRGAVLASEYDAETHMNSQLYVTRFDQATWFLLSSIGVTPARVKARKQRVAVVRQAYQFVRELRGGELVLVRSGFVAVGDRHLRFLHRMFDLESDQLIAACDCTATIAGLSTGRSVALPAAERGKAQALLVTANVAKATGLS